MHCICVICTGGDGATCHLSHCRYYASYDTVGTSCRRRTPASHCQGAGIHIQSSQSVRCAAGYKCRRRHRRRRHHPPLCQDEGGRQAAPIGALHCAVVLSGSILYYIVRWGAGGGWAMGIDNCTGEAEPSFSDIQLHTARFPCCSVACLHVFGLCSRLGMDETRSDLLAKHRPRTHRKVTVMLQLVVLYKSNARVSYLRI